MWASARSAIAVLGYTGKMAQEKQAVSTRGLAWLSFIGITALGLGFGCHTESGHAKSGAGSEARAAPAPSAAAAPQAAPADVAAPTAPVASAQPVRDTTGAQATRTSALLSDRPVDAADAAETSKERPVVQPVVQTPPSTQPDRDAIRRAIEERLKERAANPPKPAAEPLKPTSPPPPTPSPAAPPAAAAEPPAAPVGPAPKLEISPLEFDFGEVWQGFPAEREFTVKNVGEGPATLKVTTSCGCTPATQPKSPLEPGETTTFVVRYTTHHAGPVAGKTATLTSNDPSQPTVVIPVKGTVKPIFAMTPADRVMFNEAEVESVLSQTLRLENKYGSPLKLKLKEGQDFGRYEVQFKEIEEGMVYELTATTKPPLQMGFNGANIVLETPLEKVPTITIPVMANVQPPVVVIPPRLFVMPNRPQALEQTIRVQYRVDKPVQITGVNVSPDTIQYEMQPIDAPQPNSRLAAYSIRIKLPAYEELPDGAKIEIVTDSPQPEFQKISVPVVKQVSRPARPVPGASQVGPPAPTAGATPGQTPAPSGGAPVKPTPPPAAPPAAGQPSAPPPAPPAQPSGPPAAN